MYWFTASNNLSRVAGEVFKAAVPNLGYTGQGLEMNFEHLKLYMFTLLVHSDYSTRLIVYIFF